MVEESDRDIAYRTLLSVANAAFGVGAGLLLSRRLDRPARKIATISTLALGLVAIVPMIADVVTRQVAGPGSARGVRKRLRSIRDDAGFPSDGEVF